MDGGIFGFLGLIASHRGAVEYDWRTRFGKGLASIGHDISLLEAARLAVILRADPSSMVAAALEGWEYPIARAEVVALDTYDLLAAANSDSKHRPEPHHLRPYGAKSRATKRGDRAGRTRAEVVEILNRHGHNLSA